MPTPRWNPSGLVLAGVTALIILPLGVTLGLQGAPSWLFGSDTADAAKASPHWVRPGKVKASTRDGVVAIARVAIDTTDFQGQQMLNSRLGDVSTMLQLSLASQDRDDLSGPQGLQHLADDLRSRLNDFLGAQGDDTVRQVAVEELVFYQR